MHENLVVKGHEIVHAIPCSNNICLNNGTCFILEPSGKIVCRCRPGFTGSGCALTTFRNRPTVDMGLTIGNCVWKEYEGVIIPGGESQTTNVTTVSECKRKCEKRRRSGSCKGFTWFNDDQQCSFAFRRNVKTERQNTNQFDYDCPECAWIKYSNILVVNGTHLNGETSLLECQTKCRMTLDCRGINWDRNDLQCSILMTEKNKKVESGQFDHYEYKCNDIGAVVFCWGNDSICLNGGTCITLYGPKNQICVCAPGFTGSRCNETITNESLTEYSTTRGVPCEQPHQLICSNRGECFIFYPWNKAVCTCTREYYGNTCESPYESPNKLSSVTDEVGEGGAKTLI